MTPFLRRAAAALLALALTAAIVALSRAPFNVTRDDQALLRVSWSGRPERIERCRELSDEELEKVPAHMRQRLECQGRSARYGVRVLSDGAVLSTDTVSGGGLRGDRSIHMLREFSVTPGPHRFAVEVARTDSAGRDVEGEKSEELTDGKEAAAPISGQLDRAGREREERRRQRQERLPPRLRLDTTVALAPGAVLLISYDPIERRLVALTGDRQAQRGRSVSPPAR
jgi:hypothetical protein